MTDPLAHLYADFTEDEELELPLVETSLEDLTAVDADDDEELSDHDVAELALLVKERIGSGGLTDSEAQELGLGDLRDLDGELELVLNAAGRQVVKHLIAQDFPGLSFGGGSR